MEKISESKKTEERLDLYVGVADIQKLCDDNNIPCPITQQLLQGKYWIYSAPNFIYSIDPIELTENVLRELMEMDSKGKYCKYLAADAFIDAIIDHPNFCSWICPARTGTPYINATGNKLTIPMFCCQKNCGTK